MDGQQFVVAGESALLGNSFTGEGAFLRRVFAGEDAFLRRVFTGEGAFLRCCELRVKMVTGRADF